VTDPEILVDARGHRCPTPTLLLRRALQSASAGSVFRLLADDPMAKIDVPHFAAQAGLELLHIDAEGSHLAFTVRVPVTPASSAPG
jgi:tRNA 2-thiouridine synthesizing protein A